MAPEYGATMGFFAVDDVTLAYLRETGRDAARVELVEAYCRAQGLFREAGAARSRSTPTSSSSTSARSRRASPARDGRRTASRCRR